MINSQQATDAIVGALVISIALSAVVSMAVGLYALQDGMNPQDAIERDYCELVKAGTHRDWNADINCSKWGE